MKIKTRLRINTIISVCIAFAIGTVISLAAYKINQETKPGRIINEVIKEISELEILTYECLLRHVETVGTQWQSKQQSITQSLISIGPDSSPKEKAILMHIKDDLENVKMNFSQLILSFERSVELDQEHAALSREYEERLGGQLMTRFNDLVFELSRLSQIHQTQINITETRTMWAIILFVVIMASVTGILSFIVGKSISKPIIKLQEGVEIVRSGNMDAKVNIESKDEIGQLAVSFNQMVESLNKSNSALRKSKEMVEAIINNSTAAIYLKDIHGRYILINRQFERLFSLPKEKIVGKTDYDLVPEERANSLQQNDRKVIEAGGPIEFEEIVPLDDGLHCYISIKVPLSTPEGVFYGVCGISTDITERKQSEERLKVSEKKIRTWLECSPICTKIVDLDFNLQYMSTAGIKGLKIDDITQFYGKPYPFDFYPESFRNVMTKNLEKAKETGETITQEASVVDIDGSELCFHSTLVPINDDEGRIDYIMILSIDTTERKKMEEDLTKAQKLESVGILAGGIAHDFNNNLQAILSNINLAKMRIAKDDEVYGRLEESERAVLQAKDLSRQLLTFSKGGDPIKKAMSITKLLENPINLSLSGSNVKCGYVIPDGIWYVEADKGQMGQVISNIIINADHAMPEGGIIKVNAENVNVGAKDSLPLQDGKYVKISIKDHGTGIAQEHLRKIFDPYFTTKEHGSGLGLLITYSIIKKHGGHIAVESKLGVGTTFYIYIPASEKEIDVEITTNETETKHKESAVLLEGRKVLLMDDELIIAKSVAQQLRGLKYEVEIAKNGTRTVELYKGAMESGRPFDAVVMDLTIPGGMGGKETIKKLLEIDPEVKAIVASGYSNDPVMANFSEHGFCGIVTKPYEIYELTDVLNDVLIGEKEFS